MKTQQSQPKENEMDSNILSVAKTLLCFRTVAGATDEFEGAFSYIERWAATHDFDIEPFTCNCIRSCLLSGSSKKLFAPDIILHGHVDVVPAHDEMFQPMILGNKLYGRGAVDMKGAIGAMMVALEKLKHTKPKNKIALLITGDEETGGHSGTEYILKTINLRPKLVISGEPTEFNICYATKGIIETKVHFLGKSAHGARPWEGVNAVEKASDFIQKLVSRYPNPIAASWKTTINIGMISGGDAFNKVPGDCYVALDIRYVPEESSVKLVKNLKALGGDRWEMVNNEIPLNSDPTSKPIKSLQALVGNLTGKKPILYKEHYAADSRYFSKIGIPAVNFGPSGGGMHTDAEWVSLKSLQEYCDVLVKLGDIHL